MTRTRTLKKYQLFDHEVKGQNVAWWYMTHPLMIIHLHTKYHWPIWRDTKVMARTDSKFANPFRFNNELTPFLPIFLYNFTNIFFIWTVTHYFFYFIFLRNIWTIQLQKRKQKILWIRNGHFHQINAPNNVFSFIAYTCISFSPKMPSSRWIFKLKF